MRQLFFLGILTSPDVQMCDRMSHAPIMLLFANRQLFQHVNITHHRTSDRLQNQVDHRINGSHAVANETTAATDDVHFATTPITITHQQQ